MRRIFIATCIHERLDVTQQAIANWREVCDRHNVLPLIVAGVSTDSEQKFCIDRGISYVRAPNNPVGTKWSLTLKCVLSIPEAIDHVLIMGSDDFLHQEFFFHINFAIDHQGFESLYITDGTKTKLVRNYQQSMVGCGRMVARTALSETLAKHGSFFAPVDKGLDAYLNNRLISAGYFPVIHKKNTVLCDYKSQTNIWPFSFFDKYPDASNDLLTNFPHLPVTNGQQRGDTYQSANPASPA